MKSEAVSSPVSPTVLSSAREPHRELDHHDGLRPSPFVRTVRLLSLEREDIGVVVVYGIALGLLSLAVPIAVQSLVNTVAFGSIIQPLVVLTVLLAVALVGAATLRALQIRVVEMLQRRLFVRVVSKLAHRLPRVSIDAFRRSNGPELLNRFFDVFTTQKTVASLLLDGVDATLIALVGMVVLAFYHPALLAFDLVLLVSAVGVFIGFARRGTASSVDESKAKYAVASWLEEMARHPLAFKLAGGPEFGRERTETLAAAYLDKRDRHFRLVFRQLVGALALEVLASTALLALGGLLVIERQLTIGQLVASELIVTAVVASFAKLGNKIETYYDLVAAVDKLGELFDLASESEDGAAEVTDRPFPSLVAEELVVTTETGGRVGPISLRVSPGDVVVRADLSESARTALADSLFGFREYEGGTLSLAGHDRRDLSLDAVRRRVALVRGPGHLACSILGNLNAADRTLDATDAWDVLDSVGLVDEIRALPDGLATELGYLPTPLTEGQAMRLTLARALAARPQVLVVDGALDRLGEVERAKTLSALAARGDIGLVVLTSDPRLESWARLTTAGGEGAV